MSHLRAPTRYTPMSLSGSVNEEVKGYERHSCPRTESVFQCWRRRYMKTFYFHLVCFVLIYKPLLLFPVTLTSPCQPSVISLHWFLIQRQLNLLAHSAWSPPVCGGQRPWNSIWNHTLLFLCQPPGAPVVSQSSQSSVNINILTGSCRSCFGVCI